MPNIFPFRLALDTRITIRRKKSFNRYCTGLETHHNAVSGVPQFEKKGKPKEQYLHNPEGEQCPHNPGELSENGEREIYYEYVIANLQAEHRKGG